MAHLGLISCVKSKRTSAAQAKDLYISSLFRKSRAFVERHCDSWFILSAKYGLVAPADRIEPYNETLNTKSRQERQQWADRVWAALCRQLQPNDHVTILAGKRYREDLVPRIIQHGCHVDVPMQGLNLFQQLPWLSQQLEQQRNERH